MKKILMLICFLLLLPMIGCIQNNSTFTVTDTQKSQELFDEGMQFYNANKFKEALAKFEDAEKISEKDSPEYTQIIKYKVESLMVLEQYQKVVDTLEPQYRNAIDDNEFQFILAKAYIGLKKYDEAQNYLLENDINGYYSNNVTYWYILGNAAEKAGDKVKAEEYNQKGLTLVNGSTEPTGMPRIGMSPDEVRRSTWGEPKDINRTTTAYGVDEQWVYSIDRYIYLEDGIVTAIRD